MKKIIAAMLLCVASSTAFAQTEKGTQNIGASFSIQTSDSKNNYFDGAINISSNIKLNIYNAGINYAYFVADKLDLGVLAGYSYQKNSQDNNDTEFLQKVNGYFAGIQLRKYVLFNDKIGIRTGPSFTYARDKSTSKYSIQNDQVTNTDSYNGRLGLDFVFYPTKHLGITSSIGSIYYTHSKSKGFYEGSSNNFGANFVNNLNLGFFYSW
ncbi:autotransporter outer membrane beta-barrel domain-containing protein [Mucilaginibacter sp. UR6-1]|uniref:autotransporter outer membrane beta-barrel domain-containing protein n=1 Tax=Mucilaginibacter sp. UR6-1 TaxID=1435643 RepID=UPI001E61E7DC|nr:autotransporter outer membrane beta-barrel domain-containing protein [Mucilaginibacter sp. UR6-1]MCC8409729.1 autotransporter outer membrane beta-barrel domain-containing protein [Mucilaginibacter sp. UR6-1]